MQGRFAAILLAAISVTSLAACSEKSQNLVPAERHANQEDENRTNQMRERTLNQGEGYRSSR